MSWSSCTAEGAPGGGLPEGAADGNLLVWNATTNAWESNNQHEPSAGDVPVWNGTTWVPSGTAGLPPGTSDGDIIYWDGGDWLSNNQGAPDVNDSLIWDGNVWQPGNPAPFGSPSFLTSPPLYVNESTGDDADDGLTPGTALLTLKELARRYYGRYVIGSPSVTLIGTFAEPLQLECMGQPGTKLTVQGDTPVQIDSGSLTAASQAYSPGANTDLRITDGAQAWAANVNASIRFTSGAANGAVGNVLADIGAGVARISQLVNPTTGNASALPASGDTYVVETFPTQVAGFCVAIGGGMKFEAKEMVDHVESTDNINQYIRAAGQTALTTDQAPMCRLTRVKFENAVISAATRQAFYESFFGMVGTHAVCAMGFTLSRILMNGHSFTQSILVNAGARLDVQVHLVGQGAGITLAPFSGIQLTVDGNSVAAGIAVYSAAGTACLDVGVGAFVAPAIAGNTLFGASNTSTQSCRVRSKGAFNYLTTPTITGPAVDCLLGGTGTTWAAIAAAPQGSIMNANNGAQAGALL